MTLALVSTSTVKATRVAALTALCTYMLTRMGRNMTLALVLTCILCTFKIDTQATFGTLAFANVNGDVTVSCAFTCAYVFCT